MSNISKRGDVYTMRISLTDSSTGKRIQPRITARTKRELLVKAAQVRATYAAGTYIEPNQLPLSEYLLDWLTTAKVKPSTKGQWRRIVERHVLPDPIGGIKLDHLKHLHVQQFVDRRVADDLSPNHIRVMHAVLSIALRRAVRLSIIPANPATGCDLPRKTRDTLNCWNEDQIRTFLHATVADELYALWVLALTLGLRRGELVALKWSDVDLVEGTLTVSRTMTTREDGSYYIADEPKSASSRRTIKLPDVCLTALKHRRALQNERRLRLESAWSEDGAVFDNGIGGHYAYPHSLGRSFRMIVTRLGLPPIKFHGTRHSAATAMLRRGVPVHTVSRILGHANPSITLSVYAHVLSDAQQDAAEKIDQMFGT